MPDNAGFDGLEDELRFLGEHLDVPPATRDMTRAVRDRIESGSRRRWRTRTQSSPWRIRPAWRWALAFALVAGVLAGATPQGRAAVSSVLRFAGIEFETATPEASPGAPAPRATAPGERSVSLAEARHAVGFPLRVPSALGAPDEVRLRAGVVSMFWETPEVRGGTIRLDQFDGDIEPDPVYYKKFGVRPDEVKVAGRYGLWVSEDHPLIYRRDDGTELPGFARQSGPTLIWQVDGVTLRLEGIAGRDRAVATAESISI